MWNFEQAPRRRCAFRSEFGAESKRKSDGSVDSNVFFISSGSCRRASASARPACSSEGKMDRDCLDYYEHSVAERSIFTFSLLYLVLSLFSPWFPWMYLQAAEPDPSVVRHAVRAVGPLLGDGEPLPESAFVRNGIRTVVSLVRSHGLTLGLFTARANFCEQFLRLTPRGSSA